MKTHNDILENLLDAMQSITLEEMSNVKLMKRTDTKYVTNLPTLIRLLEKVGSGYYAQEIDGRRIANYHTLYWDFPEDHRFFHTHELGRVPRMKIRTRRYIDSNLCFLEIKRKDNHGKTRKKRVSLSPDTLTRCSLEGEPFLEKHTGLRFSQLVPTMSNRFQRITLVNFEKTERVTIDFNVSFHNYETECRDRMSETVIIELKRDGRTPSPLLPLLRELRIKPGGFSKYVIGSAITNSNLRQNRLKKRLHRIEKIATAAKV